MWPEGFPFKADKITPDLLVFLSWSDLEKQEIFEKFRLAGMNSMAELDLILEASKIVFNHETSPQEKVTAILKIEKDARDMAQRQASNKNLNSHQVPGIYVRSKRLADNERPDFNREKELFKEIDTRRTKKSCSIQ